MGKTKAPVAPENQRRSLRVAALKPKAVVETKKRAAPKQKAAKAKKAKSAENGNAKAEEPKAEATEAK